MSTGLVWTEWNLTPNGWVKSPTANSPAEARRHRPTETLLTLAGWRLAIEPDAEPMVAEIYRSSDSAAVAAALDKFGSKPAG